MPYPLFPFFSQARFRAQLPDSGLPESFGIITAFNPHGESLPENENFALSQQLQKRLEGLHLVHFPVTGGSADFIHAEPGFGVVCDLETGRNLGREFQQVAVFHIKRGAIHLVFCDSAEEIFPVATWDERVV